MEIRSSITLAIWFCSLIVPAILAGNQSTALHPDDICAEKKCSHHGPTIRFPFLLRGEQPEYCGYSPGYTLYCDEAHHTILELPSLSVKFAVTNIDYLSQTIEVQSTDGCLAKHLRHLDMSTTPFQLIYSGYQYSLINCSTSTGGSWDPSYEFHSISCLDSRGYKVYAVPYDPGIRGLPLENCTKMYDSTLVSPEIFETKNIFNLFWLLPECIRCELRRQICKWKNETNHKIGLGCFERKKHHSAGNQSTSLHPNDICAEKKCSPDGPTVRFPFLLRGEQPEYCGYSPGYVLYCDEANLTILELPSLSVKLAVTDIDYFSQTIKVQSTDCCLAKHLRHLDMSTTPFRFLPFFPTPVIFHTFQCSLFNCSTSTGHSWDPFDQNYNIPCLDSHGYKVYAVPYAADIGKLPLEFCTKMYDTSVSPQIFETKNIFNFLWFLPECIRCEPRSQICKWKNETNHKIGLGCFERKKHHSAGVSKILHIIGPILGCLFLLLIISAIYLGYSIKKQDKENQMRIKKFLEDYAARKPTRYSYADIKRMTNDFRDKLGEGGYGNVFKGKVSDQVFVAVKLLNDSMGNGEEFINEVGTMGTIHHVNVVRLLGFCADRFRRALVCEFLPNGSLDKFIFPQGQEHRTLGMKRLHDIAIGIARGVEYLHQGCEQRILHFDIKPHNILLDENYNPKISDFGLAKLCEKGRSDVSVTAARGTMGYIAPEVFSRHFGNVSYKSDIYSFGMLLLEMVGRRKNIDVTVQNISQVYFPEWVYRRLVNGEELIIQGEEDGEDKIAKKLAIVGLWCIQWNPVDRPSITSVLQMLEGSGENLSLPPDPFASGSAMNPADPSDERRRPFSPPLAVITEPEQE